MNTKSHPALELNGLGVSFGQRVVLDGITLSLLPEGIDVLMGPVKSGKSTLLRTLAGLYEGHPVHKSWGTISILGVPLNQDNRPLLVQQHARALDQPLLQALLLPLRATVQRSPSEWQRLGLEYLAQYGLSEFLPQAETPLLQCNIRAQRSVQILAQVLLQPPLLMIDEPTYGLNDSDAAWLVDWLKTLRTHCKLWIALHNQMQARRMADNIVLIGGGRLLAYQNTPQFFQHPANEWVEQLSAPAAYHCPPPMRKRKTWPKVSHHPRHSQKGLNKLSAISLLQHPILSPAHTNFLPLQCNHPRLLRRRCPHSHRPP